MSTMPAANYLTDNARTEGEFKAGLEAMLAATKQIPGAGVAELSYTIAAGSITPAGSGGALVIDTESSAASDDLANIVQTNYPNGSMLLLRNANAARVVVVKHAATGAGQLLLSHAADFTLDDTQTWLLVQRRSTDWYEILRSPARLRMPSVSKTADFTVTHADCGKVFECSNALTISFAAAAALGNGWTCTFINTNNTATTMTLDPNSTETIDGRSTLALNGQKAVTVLCTGTQFFTLHGYDLPRIVVVAFSATLSIDSLAGSYFEVGALTANVTSMTISVPRTGERIRIRVVQDATGGRTVAVPSGAKVAGSVASAANQASVLDIAYASGAARYEGFWTQIPV